jgi:4-hydroxybenzoyl-CoA thioesterase
MYEREWTVRFGDTDRFGIAFYPRIIEAVHDTADRFMAARGLPLWDLAGEYGIGLPIVEVGSEFDRMLQSGDDVVIGLRTDVSTRSVRFQYTGRVDGADAFTAFEQRVCVEVGGEEAVPIPPDVHEVLESAACE